jgi:hypothetical protein
MRVSHLVYALSTAALALVTAGCSGGDCTADYPPAFSIHVIDDKYRADIPFAELAIEHGGTSTWTTDDKGEFSSPFWVEPGLWSVVVAKDGYRTQKQFFVVNEGRCQNRGPRLEIKLSAAP